MSAAPGSPFESFSALVMVAHPLGTQSYYHLPYNLLWTSALGKTNKYVHTEVLKREKINFNSVQSIHIMAIGRALNQRKHGGGHVEASASSGKKQP